MVCILDLVPESLLDMQTIICDQASLLPFDLCWKKNAFALGK